jgi:hypothetical protein
MKRLFWRQNVQYLRNKKYKKPATVRNSLEPVPQPRNTPEGSPAPIETEASLYPQLNARICYLVVKSRKPLLDCVVWVPKGGQFQDKTLEEVMKEIRIISSKDFMALNIVLCGHKMRITARDVHDDTTFASMKIAFTREISRSDRSKPFFVEIEPVYKQQQ